MIKKTSQSVPIDGQLTTPFNAWVVYTRKVKQEI